MYLEDSDQMEEDLAASTRGNIVHVVEEAILAHGLDENGLAATPFPLFAGSVGSVENAWQIALETLAEMQLGCEGRWDFCTS